MGERHAVVLAVAHGKKNFTPQKKSPLPLDACVCSCVYMSLFCVASAALGLTALTPPRTVAFAPHRSRIVLQQQEPKEVSELEAADPAMADSSYDLRQVADKQGAGGGAGFNVGLVDPIASATGFVSRRFGLAGGLAVVALLAATEGREIVNALLDTGPQEGDGKLVTTPSGLQYAELLLGSGDTPKPGNVVGVDAKVSIGGKVLYDTSTDKKLAFKLGQRPFQSVVCDGVEEALRGMRPGGKRRLLVPRSLAPKGVDLPDGVRARLHATPPSAPPRAPLTRLCLRREQVPLEYELTLQEVLPGYF